MTDRGASYSMGRTLSLVPHLMQRLGLSPMLPLLSCAVILVSASLVAQSVDPRAIRVEVTQAAVLRLSGEADSNSPAVWDRVRGRNTLFVMTSINGRPST